MRSEGKDAGVHLVVVVPRGVGEAAALLARSVGDLARDLRIDPPRLKIEEGAAPTRAIGGEATRLPRRLSRYPAETETEIAERITMAIFRERWRLLAPALSSRGVRLSPELKEAAALGLALDELVALAEHDVDLIPWEAAERYPALLELHVAPAAGRLPDGARQAALDFARELTGLPLPDAASVTDTGLGSGQIRLRVRSVRTPFVQSAEGAEALPAAFARLIVRHAAMLLDAAVVMRVLLRAGPGTAALLPDVLRGSPAPALAAALRPLLAAGFGLPDAPALVAALLARQVMTTIPNAWRMTLPGTSAVPEPDVLAARLRAAIVPSALLRRAGGVGRTVSYWLLSAEEHKRLPVNDDALRDALVPLALPAARAQAVLLVPDGKGARLRELLADELPDLAVVEAGEWPSALESRPRAEIRSGSISHVERRDADPAVGGGVGTTGADYLARTGAADGGTGSGT
jgi:hypothetical protein